MLDQLPNILIAAAEAGDAAKAAAEAEPSLMYEPLMWLSHVGVGVLVLAILLCLWRMIKGPHLADRVLAGDTMAMMVAGLVVIIMIMYDTAIYYDAVLVVAILGFASTVAFAQYIGAKKKFADDPRENTKHDPENQPGLHQTKEGSA